MSTQIIQINVSPEELEALLKKSILPEMENLLSKITPQEKEKEFLTRQEAIEFLGISYVCLHDWTNQGIINAYKLGNRNYYSYPELVAKILNSKIDHSKIA